MKREHGRFGFRNSSMTIKFRGIKNIKGRQYDDITDLGIPCDVIDRVWKELDITKDLEEEKKKLTEEKKKQRKRNLKQAANTGT